MEWEGMDCIYLAWDAAKWLAFVSTVMKHRLLDVRDG
jgi:hypothetical protein